MADKSKAQRVQQSLSFTLKRVTGARINYYPEKGALYAAAFKQALANYEQARKQLEEQIRLELSNIIITDSHGNIISYPGRKGSSIARRKTR